MLKFSQSCWNLNRTKINKSIESLATTYIIGKKREVAAQIFPIHAEIKCPL